MSISYTSFRLQGANLFSAGNYKAGFAQRNANNLISKAAQLVADLESLKGASKELTANVKSFQDSFLSITDIEYNADNGFTLPDLLRAQGVDLKA